MDSIIVFKTHYNKFNVNNEERNLNSHINWEDIPYNSYDLSSVLAMQCKINAFNLSRLKEYCDIGSKERYKEDVIYLYNNDPIEFDEHGALKPCLSFKTIHDDFLEIISKDYDIFNDNVSIMPYAVVLLDDNNEYVCHTYCWIFNNKIYSCGIRNKVEAQFMKHSKCKTNNKQFDSISLYLLEGLRQFALKNGFNTFHIISPSDRMRTILKDKLNFKYRRGNPMGSYIFDSRSIKHDLYYPENINLSFASGLLYDQIDE